MSDEVSLQKSRKRVRGNDEDLELVMAVIGFIIVVVATISEDSNKRLNRDRLADAISSLAESFKEYVGRTKGPPRPTCQEIYEVVSRVLGISRHQVLRAVKRFVNGTVDEFDMLKNLPDDQKLEWILLCIAEGG